MGLIRARDIGLRLGEWKFKTGEVFYGGSPMAIDMDGNIVLAKANRLAAAAGDSTHCTYLGFAALSSVENAKNSNLTSVYTGPSAVTFCYLKRASQSDPNNLANPGGTLGIDGDDYPYDTTLSWNESDRLYIDDNGKWVNVAAHANDPYYGLVRSVASDSLEVFMFDVPVRI